MLNKQNTKNKKGFTLVETLVAIFILVLAITGPMSAAQNSLKASFLARDQIVAFYLAQDAIEYIKSDKDSSILKNIQIGENLQIISQSVINKCKNDPCEIDTTKSTNGDLNSVLTKCTSGSCDPLVYNTSSRQYYPKGSLGAGETVSKFTREIYLREVNNGTEFSVTVVVKWQPHFFSQRKIVVQENIFDWLPN